MLLLHSLIIMNTHIRSQNQGAFLNFVNKSYFLLPKTNSKYKKMYDIW